MQLLYVSTPCVHWTVSSWRGAGSWYCHCILITWHGASHKRDSISAAIKLVSKWKFDPFNWYIREMSIMWILCLLMWFHLQETKRMRKTRPAELSRVGKLNMHMCTHANIYPLPQVTACVTIHIHPPLVLQYFTWFQISSLSTFSQ